MYKNDITANYLKLRDGRHVPVTHKDGTHTRYEISYSWDDGLYRIYENGIYTAPTLSTKSFALAMSCIKLK